MAAHSVLAALLLVALTACGGTPPVMRLALLAPFEGRYREVGYQALYAARLALADATPHPIELLPVDDGGTSASAADRARALAGDPLVRGVVLLGRAAADETVLAALDRLPVIIAGCWDAADLRPGQFALAAADLPADGAASITDTARDAAPMMGAEVLSLEQFPLLRADLRGVTIVSSGSLPAPDFAKRYRASAPYAPEPGLIAPLTYDAVAIMVGALSTRPQGPIPALNATDHAGLNGRIRFEGGYWADAPIHRYHYAADGALIPISSATQ